MANENQNVVYTRIQLKYDTFTQWKTKNPTLLEGEVAIATLAESKTTTTPDNGTHPVLMKVGPGAFNSLPWVSALAADVYAWAKKETPDWTDFPALPIEVVDTGTGKFITGVTYENDKITITRDDAVNSLTATDDDIVVLTVDKNKGDVTIDGKHKKYNKGGTTSDATGNATTAGSSVTIKVPTLKVDEYGHTEFTGETSHTITIPNEVAVGDGDITIAAGAGLATGGSFNVNQDSDKTITIAHADTSNVANVTAADRTYVKSLTFDDFGHVTAVTTGTETVVDTNTAHSHTKGNGTVVTDDGGIDGDVKVNLNIAMYLDDDKNIVIYDKDDTQKTALASMPASQFIKDGMLEDVEYNAANNTLTFTWNTDSGSKTDTVVLSDIIDPYVFSEGALIDIVQTGTNVTISHETIAAPTKSAGSGREYLTGVTTDGHGHITGYTTSTETVVDTNTTYDLKTETNTTKGIVVLDPSEGADDKVEFVGAGATKVTSDANNKVTITTDLSAYSTTEEMEDELDKKLNANGWVDNDDKNGWRFADDDQSHYTDLDITGMSIESNCRTAYFKADRLEMGNIATSDTVKITSFDVEVYDENYEKTSYSSTNIEFHDYTMNFPTERTGSGTLAIDEDFHAIAKSGSIYDVAEGSNANTGADKTAHPKYLIFNCGSATEVI